MDSLLAHQLTEITKIPTRYVQQPETAVDRQAAQFLTQHDRQTAYYLNERVQKYVVVGDWHEAHLVGILVAGPFLANDDLAFYDDRDWSDSRRRALDDLAILNESEIQGLAAVMMRLAGTTAVTGTFVRATVSPAYVVTGPRESQEDEEAVVNERYREQRALVEAIEHGDRKQADQLTDGRPETFFTPFTNRVPNSPLRSAKNIGFAYNTMCRIGAEQGGLRPIYLHTVSEKYAIKIERARSLSQIWQLIRLMAQEYCDLVQRYRDQSYGRLVNEALNYVRIRSSQALTLPQIARALQTEPSVLARKVKQETGHTLFEYVKAQRIARAKPLLRRGTLTIGEIAVRVGFNDQGYFSRCFKQLVHMTPTAYAQNDYDITQWKKMVTTL